MRLLQQRSAILSFLVALFSASTHGGSLSANDSAAPHSKPYTNHNLRHPVENPRRAVPRPPEPPSLVTNTKDHRNSVTSEPAPGEPIETLQETGLNVGAILPSQTSGPVPLQQGEGFRVVSGPYYSQGIGYDELNDQMLGAVKNFIDRRIGHNGIAESLGFDINYIQKNLLLGKVEEEVKYGTFHPTRYLTVVLQFDQLFLDELNHRWTLVVQKSRLQQLSLGAGGVCVLLVTVFGYLRIDNVTQGCYRQRLKLLATGIILAFTVFGVCLARWIPWI